MASSSDVLAELHDLLSSMSLRLLEDPDDAYDASVDLIEAIKHDWEKYRLALNEAIDKLD